MTLETWIKRQGFLPEWLIGKKIRIVKWHPIVEEGYYTLIDGLIVSKISPYEIEFENGFILESVEDSYLTTEFKIQVYRGNK